MNHPKPCASPKTDATLLGAERELNPRRAFSHQAARFSCYAPLVLFFLSGASTLSLWLLGLFYLIESVAFACGIVGIIGGIRRGAVDTIRLAVLGLLLSGFPFAVVLWCSLR